METEKKKKTSQAQIDSSKKYREKLMEDTGVSFYDLNKKYILKYQKKMIKEKRDRIYNELARRSNNHFIKIDNTRKKSDVERTVKKNIFEYFEDKEAE